MTPRARTEIIRRDLYKKYVVNSPFAKHNKRHIDWVLDHVYKKLIKVYNRNEDKVISRLSVHNIAPEPLKLLPILSDGGKLEHLYIADMVVGNTIIEVDGPQHLDNIEYDQRRDEDTASLGYTTIRIPTTDLSSETIDNYLQELYV